MSPRALLQPPCLLAMVDSSPSGTVTVSPNSPFVLVALVMVFAIATVFGLMDSHLFLLTFEGFQDGEENKLPVFKQELAARFFFLLVSISALTRPNNQNLKLVSSSFVCFFKYLMLTVDLIIASFCIIKIFIFQIDITPQKKRFHFLLIFFFFCSNTVSIHKIQVLQRNIKLKFLFIQIV